jgi:hypothetical protein
MRLVALASTNRTFTPVEIAYQGIPARQKLRCYKGIMTNDSVQVLTDEQLLTRVTTVAGRERKATARLIVLLSELDARRLYLGEGYSSLFYVLYSAPAPVRTRGVQPDRRRAGADMVRSSPNCWRGRHRRRRSVCWRVI